MLTKSERLRRWASTLYREPRKAWPIYDVLASFLNREPMRLYAQARQRMVLTPLEQRVIDELNRDGIAMVRCSDLVSEQLTGQAFEWAEGLLQGESIQRRIRDIESGVRPADAKAGKFYIIRPLGDVPVLDLHGAMMQVTLSDAVLRIVAGYLGMFPRLVAVDLWYNVPVPGPAIKSQLWHRDPEDRRLVKTFLYLRDVDETSGPFCFVPGSHNRGPHGRLYPQVIGGNNYPPDRVVEQWFPSERQKICTGAAGTLVFCDTTGFHRGGQATARGRFLFNSVYTTNASPDVRTRQYHLQGTTPNEAAPAARYAIDHLQRIP